MALGRREAAFWQKMRQGLGRITPMGRKILMHRIESPGTGCGIPDVYMVDPEYGPCWVELKIADHQKVRLSPLQSAWLREHASYNVRTRIVAKVSYEDQSYIHIWRGSEAEVVRQHGLAVLGVVNAITLGRGSVWQAVRNALFLTRN